jgi:hypothetical protein
MRAPPVLAQPQHRRLGCPQAPRRHLQRDADMRLHHKNASDHRKFVERSPRCRHSISSWPMRKPASVRPSGFFGRVCRPAEEANNFGSEFKLDAV